MLLKHGFVTLTMSYQGHRINPPFIVFEIDLFEKTAGVEAFSYRLGNAYHNSLAKGSPYVSPKAQNRHLIYMTG